MKIGEAPSVVKQVFYVLSGVLKSKSNAVKGKAAHAMKAKVAVVGVIKNKNIFGSITHKMNSMFGHEGSQSHNTQPFTGYLDYAADEMPCEVLQHCKQELDLFESEPPAENPPNFVSVIEGPRVSTCSAEEEIDILSEAFIRRFRSQMILQKQNSFQRYREMLDRSV